MQALHSRSTAPESDNLVAQEIARGGPSETTGLEASVLGAVDLKPYGETLTAANLRAREVVLSPGAKIAVHAHHSRPAIVYVLEGELVEHRSDSETPSVRRQGDTHFEGPGVVHWVQNASSTPARAFSVDIVPTASE